MGKLFSKKAVRAAFFLMAISFIFATVTCGNTFSAPLLYFSDIAIGPASGLGDGLGSGAIVTIWGVNLGSSQGTSKVSFTDSAGTTRNAAYVYEWTDANIHGGHPADLYTYQLMQDIMFSIPASSATGTGTIQVTVNGMTSNSLPFNVVSATAMPIIYVGPTNCNNTGSYTFPAPACTLEYLLDGGPITTSTIIYVKNGYNDTTGLTIMNVNLQTYSGGDGTSGVSVYGNAPVSIIAYPGATAVIDNTNGAIGNYDVDCTFINVAKMTLRGDYGVIDPFDGNRIIANEITQHSCAAGEEGAIGTGTAGQRFPDLMLFYGNYIHDFGSNKDVSTCMENMSNLTHTTYFANRFNYCGCSYSPALESGPINIAWNNMQNNGARGGIHIYDEDNCAGWNSTPWLIHDNVIMNQTGPAIEVSAGCNPGWVENFNANIYNNLIINSGLTDNESYYPVINLMNCTEGDDCSDYTDFGSDPGPNGTVNFYNNTIYGGSAVSDGTGLYGNGILAAQNLKWPPSTGATSWLHYTWQNNIGVTTNPTCSIPYYSSGVSSIFSNPDTDGYNLWWCLAGPLAPPTWDANPINSNPLFTSPTTSNFSLQSGSPAIDAGTTEPIVTTDILGTPRPQGSAYDIGAFEYSGTLPLIPMPPTWY